MMIKARWVNGHAIPEEDVNWPEGSVVFVSRMPLIDEATAIAPGQDDDPAAIAQWLKWYDSLEPLVFDEREEAQIELMRKQIAEHSRHNMTTAAEGIFE